MFDPKAELANSHSHFHPFDPSGHMNDSYDSWGATNFGAKLPRKTVQNYENYRNFNSGGLQFRANDMEDDDSGVFSPPLWKTSPPRSSSSPLNNRNNHSSYRYLSPNSRTQAIARGQRELMDMVKNMPESSYELSLKDLVEHNRLGNQEECLVGEKILGNQRVVGVKRQESKKNEKKLVKIGGMENSGLFLKMVFPISLGSSKRKKNLGTKVSPKPEAKGVDKEWWKKRFSGSGGSERSGISSNSGRSGSTGSSGSSNSSRSNSSRKTSGLLPGCWSFFHRKKNKHAE